MSVLIDEKLTQEFLSLLETNENDICFISIALRRKYYPELEKEKVFLHRFISKKKHLINDLKNLPSQFFYKGQPVPNDALVVWFKINHRSLKKATRDAMKVLTDNLYSDKVENPLEVTLNALQEACDKVKYQSFDYDVTNENVETTLEQIYVAVNQDATFVVKTKNGFHLIVDVTKIDKEHKNYYNNLVKIKGIDQKGDINVPLAGCVQGGYIPHILKKFS